MPAPSTTALDENTFFMIMFTFGSLMGLVTLVYVIKQAFSRQSGEVGGWELRGARQRIAAVVRTTLAEGLRARVASGFALLILISIPIFWLTAEGDGTIKGKVQMFITYSLGLTSFLLAVLTILFSCRSLSVEIASRQIYGIATKPIPRWQIVVGKWLGVMTLNVALIAIACLMTWAGTRANVSRFKKDLEFDLITYGSLTPSQAADTIAALANVRGVGKEGMESPIIASFASQLGKTHEEIGDMLLRLPESTRVNLRRFDELRRQVLVARTIIPAPLPDFSKDIDEVYKALREQGRLPEDWSDRRIREQIYKELVGGYCAIGPGEVRVWRMQGPPPQEGRDWVMGLRFKIRAMRQPLATQVGGITLETDSLLGRWILGDPRTSAYIETIDQYPINTFTEIEIPQQGVEKDGTVIVNFQNIDPRQIDAIFDLPTGDLQVLYRVGSWELAMLQAALAMLIPLSCLAAFGVCASTFLSFPVGTLIVLTLYIISSSMGFVADSLAVSREYAPPEHDRTLVYEVRRLTVESIGFALSIGDLDPVNKLMEGLAIGWKPLADTAWKYLLAKGVIVLTLGVFILRRRELAAVIV